MMKNLFTKNEFQLDEILFEGRNKSYGAYTLRNDSDRVLTKSLFYGIAFFAAASALPFVVNAFEDKTIIEEIPYSDPFVLQNIPTEEVQTITPIILPNKVQKAYDSTVPEPTRAPKNEKKAITKADKTDAIAGIQTVDIEKPGTYIPVKVAMPPAYKKSIVDPVWLDEIEKPNNEIMSAVDEEADFTGGINAFREKVQSNFDASSFEGNEEITKAMVTFVVEKDGTISNMKVTGADAAFNIETEAAIKKIKGRWLPAKVKGQSVRSYFRFPVTMRFE